MPIETKRYMILFEGNEYPIIMPNIYSTEKFEKEFTYSGSDLGATYTPEKTTFRVWAPTADTVTLNLYGSGTPGTDDLAEQLPMTADVNGTWIAEKEGDLNGTYYTYLVSVGGNENEACDPYARATGVNGKRAMVLDLSSTNPMGWENDTNPNAGMTYNDAIIYELHVRDLSSDESSDIQNTGKFLGLTETGTTTASGIPTGLDHMKDLGITHLHLLPVYDYASVDETQSDKPQFNWGYDPENYNVPEGSYSTDPYNPEARIREFKEMVRGLHRNGIRVIMDVVYNHTFVGDGSNFSLTVPGYFYRHKPDGSYSDASGCGNETASERAMVRRYIVESVKYWAEEYHVDGFRFDLMGIHDVETMNEVKAELTKLDPSIFVYGEGWTASDSPLPEDQRAIKVNAPKLNDVAVFSDDLRDALKGSVFETTQAGFASGKPEGNEESIKFGIVGAIRHPQIDYNQILYCKAPYANKPTQVINYVSCHDDLCLMDKLKLSAPKDATPDELIRFGKLAQTIIFTSQGVPFMRAGEELLHDKKGVHNSYQSPDSINEIDWSLKAKNKDVFNYYKDLIALRKSHPAFRIATAEGVREALQFQEVNQPGVVAYTLGEHANGDSWKKIMVIFNGNRKAVTVSLPEGTWVPVCKDGRIYLDGKGSVQGKTTVSASSALILKQD